MPDPKQKSLAKQWAEIAASDAQTDELTGFQPGTTTSASQMQKASESLAGDYNKIISGPSKEQQKLENFKATRSLVIENKKAKREATLDVAPGTFDEQAKKDLGDDKFIKLKELEEEKEKLVSKGRKGTEIFDENGINLFAPIYKLRDLFYDEKDDKRWGATLEEKAQYAKEDAKIKELSKEVKTLKAPSLKKHEAIKKQQTFDSIKALKELNSEYEKLTGELEGEDLTFGLAGFVKDLITPDKGKTTPYFDSLSPEEQSKMQKEKELRKKISLKEATLTQQNKALELLEDHNADKRNAWSGINNNWRDLGTVGVHGLLSDIELYKITSKKEEERTPEEKDFLLAYADYVDVERSTGERDAFWYKAGVGAGSSIVFMESTLLTEGLGGSIKTGVQKGLQGALKKVLASTVKGSLKRKLGVALVQKVVPSSVALAGQGLASPTTYSSMLKQKIGDVRVIEDKDGNKKAVTSDASYKQFMKEYDLNKSALEHFISKLNQKENLSPEDEAKLEEYQSNLRNLDSEKELLRPKSWGESFVYGYTETLKEFGSEKYVGRAGNKLIKGITQSKLGKYLATKNPLQKSFKSVKEITDWGQNYVNNTTVGKISSKALYHTGANKVYDGLPGEIIEEIAVQATPTFRTGNFVEEYKNQLRELANPTFYADVVGQTVVMSGGTTTLGAVGSAVNYRKRKQFYNERTALREAYKNIDKSVTDEDLAETILMASGGTAFSQVDYDHKVMTLRNQNTEASNKAADAIEQKKFVNLAVKAIKTNTLDEFEQTLDALSKNKDAKFSEATVMNIGLAKQKIAEIKKVYEAYGQKSNVGQIVDLAVQKMTAKQSIDQLDTEILNQRALANDAYKAYLQTLGANAPSFSAPGDIDSLLNAEGTTPEEESELDKFTRALEETNDPAIQTYVNLLAAKDNMQAARRMTMKNFNEAVSPQYEVNAQKTKAVARQFQQSLDYLEKNNITDAGVELDAFGKVILNDSFIDNAFLKIDTMGLSREKVNKMKDDYKRVAKLQANQKQAGSFDRIAMLHDYAKNISQDKLDELNTVENPYQIEEIKEDSLTYSDMDIVFNKYQVKNTQDPNAESFIFDSREEAEQKITELNEVQDASAEEVAKYERELETVKQGLYHPIALESEVVTDEFFDTVDSAAPVLLDEFHTTGKVSSATIENLFNLNPGIVSETLSKAITDNLTEDEIPGSVVNDALDSIQDTIQELQSNLDAIVAPSNSTEEAPTLENPEYITTDSDDFLDATSLLPRKADFGPEQVAALGEFAKNSVKIMEETSGQKPTFKDFIYYYVRFVGKEKAEESFEAYKIAWEAANLAPTNYAEVYDDIFEPGKKVFLDSQAYIDSLFNNTPTNVSTVEQVQQSDKQELAKVEQLGVKSISFNEDNVPVKTSNNRRISGTALRFGFNAIKYEEVEELDANGKPTGSFVRVAVLTDTLNYSEGPVDFRELLDPNKYNTGDSVNVGMVPESEWGSIRVYVGRDSQNNPVTKPYSEIYQEKIALDPNYRNTEDFINTVPVVAYNNQGVPVAHIHESSWYNAWNVSDPTKSNNSINPTNISLSHKQAIDAAQKTISDFRKAVVSQQVKKVTIAEKVEGAFYSLENKKDEQGNIVDLISLSEANPQSVIAVQGNQAILETGTKSVFENEKRVIINKDFVAQIGNRGKTWNLRRIGTDSEGRETWRAFATSSYKNISDAGKTPMEEIETVRWAWSAYAMFDTVEDTKLGAVIQDVRKKHVADTPYDLTEEQAKKIIKDIKDITGYNLMRYQDADAFFSLFFHPKTGNSRAEFGRQVYSASEKGFYLNISRDGLGKNMQIPMISNGIVTNTNKTYQEYLKDKLTTGVRSFNIGTAENPNYVTSVQPSITFEYSIGEVEEQTPEIIIENNTADLIASTQLLKERELSVEELIEEAKKLQQELGFRDNINSSALPSTMQGVEALKNIFNLTPGLDIAQEAHLIDFIYNFINTAIDVKYNSKVSKEKLLQDVANSYSEIVSPSREKVRVLLDKMIEANTANTSAELRQSIAGLRTMLRTLDNIESNWNTNNIKAVLEATNSPYTGQMGIIEKAMEEVSKTSDIKEKQDDPEEEASEADVTMRVKSFEDNASLTESGKSKTSYRLRRFMSGIKRIDLEGNVVKGFLGLPSYVNYNEVYDSLYQLLGSGVYIESNYDTMKAKVLSMEIAQPWVKELMEKFDKADAQLRNEFVVNYRKHAVAMKFTMFTQNNTGSRLQVYDTNANEVTRVIIKEWENNFKTGPLVKLVEGQYAVDKVVAQKLLDQYNSWNNQGFAQEDSTIRNWVANFGIEFSDGYWKELKDIGFTYQNKSIPFNQIFDGSNVPIGLLVNYLHTVLKIENPQNLNFEENEKAHPFKDMQAVLKAVAKGESRYSGKILSKNFRDGGKNISGITNPTFVTDKIDDLIRSASSGDMDLINTLKSLSISSNSVLLELLQKEPDFYKKVEANYLGITALKEYGKESGMFSSITDLNSLDHDITKLGMFQDTQQGKISYQIGGFSLRMGRMFLPTMSDKSQMLSIATGVFNFMSESQIAFEKDEEGNIKFTEDLRDLLYQKLILPEMKRISNFHKNVKATDIKDYDKAAQLFNFFPALNMLKDDNGDRIVQHLATQGLESVEKMYKQQLIDVVENTMHSLAQEKADLLSEFKEFNDQGKIKSIKFFDTKYLGTGKGTLEDKFEVATYDFVLNSVLTNADMFTVVAGDPALFSQDKLFKGVDEPYFATNDNFYTNLAEKQGINIGKRLALLVAPGRTLAESVGKTYKQVFLKDSVDITENAEYLISLFEGEKALNQPLFEGAALTVKEALEEYKTANATRKTVIRKALKTKFEDIEKLGDYFDIESTDAQEYTTLKEHLFVLYHDGKLAEAKYKELVDKAEKGLTLSKKDIGFVLQPVKPVYTGQIFDKDENGAVKNDVGRIVYIKSSSFPLIPQLTAGLSLDNLRVSLEGLEKKYGEPVRASYQTANKVGAKVDSQTIDPLNVESLKGIETAMLTLNRKDFRIQQDVPFKSDLKKEDKIAMGTQIFKLLFGDGVIDLKGFSFDGKNNLTGKQLYDEYNRVFTDLIQTKKQGLFNELGLNELGTAISEEKTMLKLQNLLQKEAINRDFPTQDIRSLGIETLQDKEGNTYFDFKTPLWLTTNSDRFESLLNAIVTNRLMNHKMPGNSFVAASENGFKFKDNLEGIGESKVIYFDNYNGVELQGAGKNADGSYRKAQVLAPSKFKNKEGKLIDLFEKVNGEFTYVEKRENDTWRLKDGVIDSELLNQFTFRIPTSSHVSASSIEIVGILPPEVGDLIITPKSFTKQMGQDFDVDKLNTYQLHHIVDSMTGKVEVLSQKHKERATSKLRNLLEELDLEKIKLQRKMLPAEVTEFLGKFGKEEKIDLTEYFDKTLLEEVLAEESSVQEKLNAMERKFNEKLLENDFIKLHTSVFNNPSPEMQGKINKVLSMDFARQQASLIQDLSAEGQKYTTTQSLQQEGLGPLEAQAVIPFTNTAFTILSDEYQKKKMGLGSAGKMAIGIYSNYVTFHSLVQQTPQSLNLMEEGEESMIEKKITIGNLVSNGKLGGLRTLDNSRSIAEVFAERQNTATDNEKEQILGRVNINGLTIGVDSLLTLLGFDKIPSSEGPLSVAYALLSQPILKEYVEKMQKGTGVTAVFNANLEDTVIEELIAKYGGNLTPEELVEITGEDLDGDSLVEGLTTNGSNPKTQIAALQTFLDLNTYAKNIAKVQSVLFIGDLGKSIVESNVAFENLSRFSENKLVSNVSVLIGDFLPINEDFPVSEGYSVIGNYYVKPTTPQGQIVVEGLRTAQLLWSDFFPYNDPSLQSIIKSIMQISGNEDASKYKTIEKTLGIIKEVKKYVYSWKGLGLYTESTSEERKRLFMSNSTNTSLAEYLNTHSKSAELVSNKLLSKFTYEIETDGRPSLVKYNNTISDNLEEKYLYNSLAELMIEDKPLPDWNGKPFSTKQLAQELINYAYLEGGVQQAVQFIKYVPVEYLSQVGVNTPQGFLSAATVLQRISVKRDPAIFNKLLGTPSDNDVERSPFIRQFFQHNPDQAPSYSEDIRKDKFAFDKTKDSFILNLEETPKYISIRNKTASKLKQDKFSLFEHVGNNTYKRIGVLGTHGMNEYQAGVTVAANSIMEKKTPAAVQQTPGNVQKSNTPMNTFNKVFDASLGTVQDNSSVADTLKAIANSSTAKSARYKALAAALLPFASVNTKVSVSPTKNVFGVTADGAYVSTTDTIVIDNNLKIEKRESVFMHEVVHALTLKDLKKYYEVDTDGFYTILKPEAPSHVKQLDTVWRLYIDNTDAELREKAKQKTLDLRAKKPVIFTMQEREIGYPSVDIFEFLAVAIESEDFQKHLNSIVLPGGQTLLDKFVEAIKTILTEIGVEIKKGSLAEKSLNEILNFMQVESEIKQESATFASIDIDTSQMEEELFKRAQMEQETTEQSFEEDIDLSGESSGPEESLLPYSSDISQLGLTEEEWNTLSQQEQQKIKECN
jgi:hypothetical protein